jgi:hypothetical protein
MLFKSERASVEGNAVKAKGSAHKALTKLLSLWKERKKGFYATNFFI